MTHATDDPSPRDLRHASHTAAPPVGAANGIVVATPATPRATSASATSASAGDAARRAAAAPLHRDRMLEVTDTCLREFGYDGATIRRIAARLGCAVGTIYRFFPDKRALMTAVTQQRFEPVAQCVEAGEAIADAARDYLEAANDAPHHYRLMFWLCELGPAGQPLLPGTIARILDGWARQLGDVRLARRSWSQLHGSLMLGLDADETIETLLTELGDAGATDGAADDADRLQDAWQGWRGRDAGDDLTLL
ncbi:MAG: TetR/AcrR family transcriptional regulator [Phycisphaeraceae bacterium]